MSLYPFQQQAVEYHLAHHYSLNCSEMGLGKSRMALAAAKATGLPVAVIAPPFLRSTWLEEGKKVGVAFDFYPYSMLHGKTASSLKNARFWIADECHYLKTPTTRRTHAFYALLKDSLPDYFIGLTGTPIKNRVPDFWTLLAFCGLNPKNTSGKKLEGDLTKWKAFSRHFCEVERTRIQGFWVEKFTGIKEHRIPEFKSLLVDKFIRFRVSEVLKDLPELTRKEVSLNLKPTPDLLETFNQYILGHKADVGAKKNSAVLKAFTTIEYCKDMQEEGCGPLLVFSDHVEPAAMIAKGLNGSLITGATPMHVRQEMVLQFQQGMIPALVCTIGSMSVGVTLTAARHVVFNDLSWVPADNLQAEKRIHRIGQKDACFAHYIDATPTDSYIRKTLFQKLDTIERTIG